jgi:hypothetical protein
VDERDEDPWAVLPLPPPLGLGAREQRERERERRLAAQVSRHRERGVQPSRRDRGLTRDEIVAIALAVADAEGVAAVSMRRIARELNAGVMSLYWHVASKEELQDLMLASVEAEIVVPEPSGDWLADMRTLAQTPAPRCYSTNGRWSFMDSAPHLGRPTRGMQNASSHCSTALAWTRGWRSGSR